jgi:hypothetical protein
MNYQWYYNKYTLAQFNGYYLQMSICIEFMHYKRKNRKEEEIALISNIMKWHKKTIILKLIINCHETIYLGSSSNQEMHSDDNDLATGKHH